MVFPSQRIPKIQVFLETRDRPNLVVQAVKSILEQSFQDFHLVLSDNSTNFETKEIFSKFSNPKLSYVFRNDLSGAEHWNKILEEIRSEFVVVFHDDDLMMKDFLEVLFSAIDSEKDLVAVAGNAFSMFGSKKSNQKAFKDREDVLISTPVQLFRRMLRNGYNPPYSSYLYRSTIIKDLPANKSCGNQSDAASLRDVINRGKILWKCKPLMYYRYHSGQDSTKLPLEDRRAFLKMVLNSSTLSRRSPLVCHFRINLIIKHYLRKFGKIPKLATFLRLLRIFYLQLRLVPFQIPFGLQRFLTQFLFKSDFFSR